VPSLAAARASVNGSSGPAGPLAASAAREWPVSDIRQGRCSPSYRASCLRTVDLIKSFNSAGSML